MVVVAVDREVVTPIEDHVVVDRDLRHRRNHCRAVARKSVWTTSRRDRITNSLFGAGKDRCKWGAFAGLAVARLAKGAIVQRGVAARAVGWAAGIRGAFVPVITVDTFTQTSAPGAATSSRAPAAAVAIRLAARGKRNDAQRANTQKCEQATHDQTSRWRRGAPRRLTTWKRPPWLSP